LRQQVIAMNACLRVPIITAILIWVSALLGVNVAEPASAVKTNAALIFASAHQVTLGNSRGDVTLVAFFDYNCGYCKRAFLDHLNLITSDSKLRLVVKEFPVLGSASVEAAQIAIAVRMQEAIGGKYLAFYKKLMSSRGRADQTAALTAAREAGCDMPRLERDLKSSEVTTTLEEVRQLAQILGVSGTPSYVIGDEVLIGAIEISKIRDLIRNARNTAARPAELSTLSPQQPASAASRNKGHGLLDDIDPKARGVVVIHGAR
jgi:protein-disulfide isomerase